LLGISIDPLECDRNHPAAADRNPSNNSSTHQAYTRCSFDPNDKQVSPPGCGPAGWISNNQPLTYTVQFQNLGLAPAFDVVVRDSLDPALDLSTLQILGASHKYVYELNGREMTWTFADIYLPDAADDEANSHGSLTFRVWPLAGLPNGTTITNQARVFFDNNPPVLTPATTNTLTSDPQPVASFTVAARPGSAAHTNDFTYTGGTVGATFLWNFGPDAVPPSSTVANPTGVVFPADGLKNISLQVRLGDCDAVPASYLLNVGQPRIDLAAMVTRFASPGRGRAIRCSRPQRWPAQVRGKTSIRRLPGWAAPAMSASTSRIPSCSTA